MSLQRCIKILTESIILFSDVIIKNVQMATEIAVQDECSRSGGGIREKFKDAVDWDEFKSRAVSQVMTCHTGRAPLDYYLAELAVDMWMQHFDKTPDELEDYIRSTPLAPREESTAGEISVIDTANDGTPEVTKPVKTYKDALLASLPEELYEPPHADPCSGETSA